MTEWHTACSRCPLALSAEAGWKAACRAGTSLCKAELMETEGRVGCIPEVSQADGAQGPFCCLLWPCLLAIPHCRAVLPQVFPGAWYRVLPGEMCKVLQLLWHWEQKSKKRSSKLCERGDKGLLKDPLEGWKAAAAAALRASQPQGLPCTSASQAGCPWWTERCWGASCPGARARRGQRALGSGSAWGSGRERLQLGPGGSRGRAERCGPGPGCAPVSMCPGREGWRAGGEAWISSAPPQCSGLLERALESCRGGPGERAGAPEPPKAPCFPPDYTWVSTGSLQEVVREGGGTLRGLQCCRHPWHSHCAPGPGTGTKGPCSTVHLGGAARSAARDCFCSAPTAAALPYAKAQEQAEGPAEACTPGVCTRKSSGRNARR